MHAGVWSDNSHHNRTYGVANPGYVPAAAAVGPAMFAPPAAGSPGPSAPPASMFDSMPGYEGTLAGGGGGFLPPPMPAYPVPQPEPGPEQPHWNIPSISEDTAREAFVLFASSKCCYSSAPAKDGVITGMEAFNTYRYRLETFTESRLTEWSHEPYNVVATVTDKDRPSVPRVVENNSFWTNNIDNYVVEQSSGLQVDNLSKVSGKELFRDSQYMVYPVVGFPDPAVVQAAQRLVNEHQGKYSQTSRILQQRQTIELIPVTKVTYSWKGNSHIYFVYGNEFKVSADNYPATCCCSVM
ncbi:Protein SSUH2-like protein [Larimichthys crocea]|uniref:Uncharacterized protein n=1 Tax=Larimichthys crocea TaxID=215358 RepID=A0ACD3RAY0_LARCR|nr:Protein SSUH2-like protein [Larimichthys crocea]